MVETRNTKLDELIEQIELQVRGFMAESRQVMMDSQKVIEDSTRTLKENNEAQFLRIEDTLVQFLSAIQNLAELNNGKETEGVNLEAMRGGGSVLSSPRNIEVGEYSHTAQPDEFQVARSPEYRLRSRFFHMGSSSDSSSVGERQQQISCSRYEVDFEELGPAGRGGYGEVFKCRHKLDKMIYAIKRIGYAQSDEEQSKAILSEVYALSGLQHRNIVRYHQAWIEPYEPKSSDDVKLEQCSSSSNDCSHCLNIQMEFCTGSLQELLKKGIDESRAWNLFEQIVDGLSYIHKNGFIHGDLTSQNIFLNDSLSCIKIGDFGLAIRCEDGNKVSVDVAGNEFYRAPEVERDLQIDFRADIFSLGIVFFELFYPTGTEQERRHHIRCLRDLKFPADLIRRYQAFAIRLLSKNPEDRPSAEQVSQLILASKPSNKGLSIKSKRSTKDACMEDIPSLEVHKSQLKMQATVT